MTTPRQADKRASAAKNEPFAHVMQIISRTARSADAAQPPPPGLFWSQLPIAPVSSLRPARTKPTRLARTGLSAVTFEPLRSRAAHVVQLGSIAAVRQGGCNGSENGQEIHPRFPHAIPHAACSDRQFRPTHG